MKKTILLILIILIKAQIFTVFSQDSIIISNLSNSLNTATEDTVRVKILIDLSQEYMFNVPEKAREYANQAINIAEPISYLAGIEKLYRIIGIIQSNLGNYAKAIDYFEKSLKTAKQRGNKSSISKCLNNIGLVHSNYGNYTKAIEYFQMSLKIAKELNVKVVISSSLINIGMVYENQGNYAKATEYYEKALKIDEELDDKSAIAHSLNNIGSINMLQKNYQQALESFEKALEICNEIGDQSGIAWSVSLMGDVYIKLQQHNKALHYLETALSLHQILGEIGEEALDIIKIGDAYAQIGDHNNAIKYSLKGLKIAKIIKAKESIKYASEILASSYAKQNKFEKAYQYHVLLKETYDSIFTLESQKRLHVMESRFEMDKIERQIELHKALLTKQESEIKILIGGIIATLAIVILIIIGYLRIRKVKIEITEQKHKIEDSNKKIKLANDDLQITVNTVRRQKDKTLKAYINVKKLGIIGQQITANLSIDTIINIVYENIVSLLDVTIFSIGIYDNEKKRIYFQGIGKEKHLEGKSISINEINRPAVCCFLNNEELIFGTTEKLNRRFGTIEGIKVSEDSTSIIYLPLIIKDKTIGIITVQNSKAKAYRVHHVNILRNIANYTAIALDNADAYNQIEEQKLEIHKQKEELQVTLEHLKSTQSQLIQAEKMASLGQLIAGIAHEINTPIGAINSSISSIIASQEETFTNLPNLIKVLSIDLLDLFFNMINEASKYHFSYTSREERTFKRKMRKQLEEYGFEEANKISTELCNIGIFENIEQFMPLLKNENIDIILETANNLSEQKKNSKNTKQALERVAKIVFALKNYSQYNQTGKKTKCDIRSNVDSVLAVYLTKFKQGIEIIKNYNEIPTINCFPDELSHVWTNIIHNAIQAMDCKGQLKIDILPKKQDNNEYISVAITDTGEGMSPEILKRIFEPFFTTQQTGEGCGLGLDIVNKIMEKHSGKIDVISEVGKGSTFNVLLPIH